VEVRTAIPDDQVAVARVLDAAMLATDGLAERLAAGDVLVAVERSVHGALVVAPPAAAPPWAHEAGTDAHVAAVAVRRSRRGRGVGTALVERAGERGRLTAGFDPDLRPFYDSCGFSVQSHPTEGDRLVGARPAP
jgi:GNAT superfamily N-acetyltransferase